ncbi:MAG TPA: tRNA guanosine(34) transglycosylase Tgt, partial [Candidatus Sulfotelmatobacter sp.]|nr:tRNA guanosine(34) transglycosylase Tgt [Candidatus Sulfotelmatobacter sp.]
MSQISFKITKKDKKTKARAGIIKTPHGNIETPIFIPVGTNGTVKSVSPRDLQEMGAQVILANTYHLHLRPGEDLVKKFGGLSKFMSWGGPTMTDSGGFQVFSLGIGLEHGVGKLLREEEGEAKPRLNKITKEGVTFQSHLDGSKQYLSPEVSIKIQEKIGADLIVAFDDLESPKYNHEETSKSLDLTQNWLLRSIK